MNNQNYLSRVQADFENLAFVYGVQPAVCTLLGEYVTSKLQACWQSGEEYAKRQTRRQFPSSNYLNHHPAYI